MAMAPRGSRDAAAAVRRWCVKWFSRVGDGDEDAAGRAFDPRLTSACRARWPADDLLLRRMHALNINVAALSDLDEVAMDELRTTCAACPVPAQCARDLADEFADPGWQEWRNYCPNAPWLTVLRTLDALHARASTTIEAGREVPAEKAAESRMDVLARRNPC